MPAGPPADRQSGSREEREQDALYEEAAAAYGAALERLARAYEANVETRRDLLQEIHVALWRSFDGFAGRCSLRTWVYRVAHNVATSHALRERRRNATKWVTLEEAEEAGDLGDAGAAIEERDALRHMMALVRGLEPLDRKVILSYLEGIDAASIGEITGLSAKNVATKIHRIKNVLARRAGEGGRRAK